MMILGVDVSKDKLDIWVLPDGKHYCINNTTGGIRGFFRNTLRQNKSLPMIKQVIFEATGGYEKQLHVYLNEENIPHHRVHPTRARRFAQCKGHFAKTDRIDARLLAQYGEQKDIEIYQTPSKIQLEMQELSARKEQLKAMISAEKHRLGLPYLNKQIKRSIKRHMKQLGQELETISQQLEQLIADDEKLQEKHKLLKSVKGIGDEVATILVAQLPELGHISREAISHLVGVAPQTNDSGKKRGYRPISNGRNSVRKALYMSALVAVQHNQRMKLFYQKLLLQGKLKKVALVAVIRKMLIMINAMVKNGTTWEASKNLA